MKRKGWQQQKKSLRSTQEYLRSHQYGGLFLMKKQTGSSTAYAALEERCLLILMLLKIGLIHREARKMHKLNPIAIVQNSVVRNFRITAYGA